MRDVQTRTARILAGLLIGLAWRAFAQAPLLIEGVSDKSTYTDTVTLRVPSTNGHTYEVRLDGERIPTDWPFAVHRMDYHELEVFRTNSVTGEVTNRLARFIVLSSQRGSPEKGLIAWAPYPPIHSTAAEMVGAQLRLMTPRDYPLGLPIPVVAAVDNGLDQAVRVNGWVTAPGFESNPVQILRGHGSALLPAATNAGAINYDARLHALTAPKTIQIEADTAWTAVSGLLSGVNEWPENARIHVIGHLTVATNALLTIGAGAVIKLNPLTHITNSGAIFINGTPDRPVVFTATNMVWPEQTNIAWGGFIMRGSNAQLVANGAILAGGGGLTNFGGFSPGASHRKEQAVLLVHSGALAALTNCAIIHSAGQVGNGYNCQFYADHCLFQRAITGGEYSGSSSLVILNHCAVIEFPNDNGVVNAEIVDADYDGIYFTEGTHILMNSLFGFAKDDAVDSGSGNAGTMFLTNCWIESAQHEAQAWSGSGRKTWTYDSVNLNCGQGLEAGWNNSGDFSPDCFGERLLLTANAVGARFGDNYDWAYPGFLRLTNSLVLHNYRDIFLKTWNSVKTGWDTNSWVDRDRQVDFQSNFVTTADPRFPGNQLWDPATEFWRLTNWMTTPPAAPVGVGLAIRTNRFAMTGLFDGVPVRLSTFTTNVVSVNYTFEGSGGALAGGVLVFSPGETVKKILPTGFDPAAQTQVELVLRGAVNGELTDHTNALFAGAVAGPQVSLAVVTNLLSTWRLTEGIFVQLDQPSALGVSLDYRFDSATGLVASGTLVIDPAATQGRILLSGANPFDFDYLRLTVTNPVNAALVGTASVVFTNPPLTLSLGVASNQLSLDSLVAGIPAQLSAPAGGSGVSVDFQIQGNRGAFTNGVLQFSPGQNALALLAPSIVQADQDLVRVRFSNAQHARFNGPDTLYYLRSTTPPVQSNLTLVARGSGWHYFDQGAEPPAGWKGLDYPTNGWGYGLAQLGYGESDQATTITRTNPVNGKVHAAYFRQVFYVDPSANFTNLLFWLLYDDGAVVYLNSNAVFRVNMSNDPISYLSWATAGGENSETNGVWPSALLWPGANVVAVEVHQDDSSSSDISFDFELIGVPVPLPSPPQALFWGRFDAQLALGWGDPSFRLLEATNLAGPWTTNPAASLLQTAPTNRQRFFRLQK